MPIVNGENTAENQTELLRSALKSCCADSAVLWQAADIPVTLFQIGGADNDTEAVARCIRDNVAFRAGDSHYFPLHNGNEVRGCLQLDGKAVTTPLPEQLPMFLSVLQNNAIALPGKPIISVRALRKSYRSSGESGEVLHGVSFQIYENEFVVILGASGTGKTTLLNIIGGLDSSDSGQVLVDGSDVGAMSAKALNTYRRHQVGFIFQFYSLLPTLTAEENLRYVAEKCKKPLNPLDVLKKMGLWEKRRSFPSQLSSGQQQRVAIARALVKRPSIILADEPTGALDLSTSRDVLMAMEEITTEHRGTILLITHNPEISRIADRVITMRQGNIESIAVNPSKTSARELRW